MGSKFIYFNDENGETKRELLDIGLDEKLGVVHGKILKMLEEKNTYVFDNFRCVRVEVDDFVNDDIPVNFRIGGINTASFEKTLREALERHQYKFYHEYNVHFNVENRKEFENGDVDIVAESITERYRQWLEKIDCETGDIGDDCASSSSNSSNMATVFTSSATPVVSSNESSWIRNIYLWFGRILGIRDLDARRDSDGTPHRPLKEVMDVNFTNTQFDSIYSEIRTTDGRVFSQRVERDVISGLDQDIPVYGNFLQSFYRIASLPAYRNMSWQHIIDTILVELETINNERPLNAQRQSQNVRGARNANATQGNTNTNGSNPFVNILNLGMNPVNTGGTVFGSSNIGTGAQPQERSYYYSQTFPVRNRNESVNNNFEDIMRRFFGDIEMEDVRMVVSQSDIDKLLIVKYNKDEPPEGLTDNTCVICQDEFKDGEELTKLPCVHYFHKGCIFKMLKEYSNKCPTCRNEVAHGVPLNQNDSSSTTTNAPNNRTNESNGTNGSNGFGFTFSSSTPISQDQAQFMVSQLGPDQVRQMASQIMNGDFSYFLNFANTLDNLGIVQNNDT